MLKHTPGPWAWQKFGNFHFLTAQHGFREIIIGSLAVEMPQETFPAMNDGGKLMPVSPDLPNAKLIASAPDLLEACQEMYKHLKENDFDVAGTSDQEFDRWWNAINNATT